MAPFPKIVTLVKRTKGDPDALGNDTWTILGSPVSAAYAPGGSAELIQGQDTLTSQPIVYLPPGTDVTHIDAVIVDGTTYEVDGSPNVWVHPLTGWSGGVEVRLRGAQG